MYGSYIEMQNQDFFLGEFKHCTKENYYVPYTETRQNSVFVFIGENDAEMFVTSYQYEAENISKQLTTNGYVHNMVERIDETTQTRENEIPNMASLYLTDKTPTVQTIEGEDMTLDVYMTNYNWRNEVNIVYIVVWTTDSKKAPKEIEARMNDYFISEIAHIQQVLVDSLMNHAIIVNEPVLDCKFECMNHTSQACSQDIADATLFRITEVME